MTKRKIRAVGLMSGGLDSTLAAGLLKEQGVEVQGIHFSTGFCKVDHRRARKSPRDLAQPKRLRNEALAAGASLEVPVDVIDVADEFLHEVVLRPRHGYGSAINPCIDCRIFMLRKASEIAEARGADVVFTGEVLGQRPMSQHKHALRMIENESGLGGRLLRPLSARHLIPTESEENGEIERDRLGEITGRSRKTQIALAARMGVKDYPTPSGGCCYLADENFARRLRDLLAHSERSRLQVSDMFLLKIGRHFRIAHDLKTVVARDEAEGQLLETRSAGHWVCQVADGRGALARVEGEPGDRWMGPIASLAARYSRQREAPHVSVRIRRDEDERLLTVSPATDDWARKRLV